MNKFIQLKHSSAALELLKDNRAFVLATVIALRSRQDASEANAHGLAIGEAWIGDSKNYGMTPGQYRLAKTRLKKNGIATFKTTNKGTIARLVDSTIISVPTEIQPSDATNKLQTNRYLLPREAWKLSKQMIAHARKQFPESKRFSGDSRKRILEQWARHFERMHRLDLQPWEEIMPIFRWAIQDSYWSSVVISPRKFRENYESIRRKMEKKSKRTGNTEEEI